MDARMSSTMMCLGTRSVPAHTDGVLQLSPWYCSSKLLEHGEADPLLDAALALGVEVHVAAEVAHVVGEDLQGLAVPRPR